jgi:hypothetical protein
VTHTLIRKYQVTGQLGRHQKLDPRSLDYIETGEGVALKEVDHEPPLAVLDQEDLHAQGISVRSIFPNAKHLADADALGSCVGNATTVHASEVVGLARLGLTDPGNTKAAEIFAIGRYHRATMCDDDLRDEYPSVDCGSSGLGSAQACHADGLISGYRHAMTVRGLLALLQKHSAMIGTPWFNAWFTPDASGFIDSSSSWDRSGVAGGHEVCITAVEKLVLTETGQIELDKTVLRIRNSWDSSWADHGSCRLRLSTYQQLRSEIDIVQFAA